MPPEEPIEAFAHIAVVRLRELATVDTAIATDVEFRHLQACSTCFKLWKQFRGSLVKQHIVRFPSGQYVSNCRIGSNFITYERTYSPANATRFYGYDLDLVLKRLAEKGEPGEREDSEDDGRQNY